MPLCNIMKPAPLISVCIPVYSTEQYLAQCLRSVLTQNFDFFEVVVVSDASPGKDQKGRGAKKIVQAVQKEFNRWRKSNRLAVVSVRFVAHRQNRGVVETRRTLAYEAKGKYVTQVDSDDEMTPGALAAFYKAANSTGSTKCFDIVHGSSVAGTFDEKGEFVAAKKNTFGTILYEAVYGREVFRKWFVDRAFTANVWGKLIKRDVLLQAYKHIPYTECNMADDLLLFFFVAQSAKSYIGIKDIVYHYRVDFGMSSHRKIDTLKKWQMICSTASVFTVILQWLQKIQDTPDKLLDDEVEILKNLSRFYLSNNIKQMKEAVIPELQQDAYQLLCEYWGQDYVDII